MTVYEAAKEVREHYLKTVGANTVQATAVFGYNKGDIIKFDNEHDARLLDEGCGYLFRCVYRNGTIDVTPFT